jgi:vancomycin resistance protein YoaR
MKLRLKLKFKFKYHKYISRFSKVSFWFFTGALLSLFFIGSFGMLVYEKFYAGKIYPGIFIENVDLSGKSKEDVKKLFEDKNLKVENKDITFTSDFGIATISAQQINFGYDENLSSEQAYSLGRSRSVLSNARIIFQAYSNRIRLSPTYSYDEAKLEKALKPLSEKIDKEPVNALFNFQEGRVTAFKASQNGQTIDNDLLNKELLSKSPQILSNNKEPISINVPIKPIEPEITTEKVNDLGIKELIGEGHSTFYHSIPSRVFNVNLAASRVNGILVPPGEIFSFDKALGDVSSFTGFKQAYVIQNGKTVLGDGGGVCQVSTTFFRAILNAGMPITERNAHAYRVGYYEQDSSPGFDATIYTPTVDLKFKNDTNHHILIQSVIDLNNLSLSYYLYGTKDGREVSISKPVITNQTPAPPDLFVDDPTLKKGEIKQTDFSAPGANVYFTREVTKNGKVIISDKFFSNYRPWQAIFLRGTLE